jgi:hypothetical protein
MKTIPISPEAKEILELLQQARRENIIVQSPDGSEFILAEIDTFDREIEVTRQNKALMALLDERGKQDQTISLAEAKFLLGIEEPDKNDPETT